jgi:hypothetical protein
MDTKAIERLNEVVKVIDLGGETDAAGATRWKIGAKFADGTKLVAIATAPAMPLSDMTPGELTTIDDTAGMEYQQMDNGSGEAWNLQEQAAARQVLLQILSQLEASQ